MPDAPTRGFWTVLRTLPPVLKGAAALVSALVAGAIALNDHGIHSVRDFMALFSGPDSASSVVHLRAKGTTLPDGPDFILAIKMRGFSLPGSNVIGDFKNDFKLVEKGGAAVVVDRATGLMWQQSGSDSTMSWGSAQNYIATLNRNEFFGYSDWRLPTVDELASLVSPKKNEQGLFIDPIFDSRQAWCRSADKESKTRIWGIYFIPGAAYKATIDFAYYVRAVRSM